jgi:glycosyltransferase involved in cell wall biosynthesis
MHLGFHYHVPAICKDNHIFMPGYLGRFIDRLAMHCKFVTCFLHEPRSNEISLLDYPLAAENVALVNIGPHDSISRRMIFAERFAGHVLPYRKTMDLMLIRGPSPLLPAMARAVSPVPTGLLLVGDYLTGVNDLPQPGWRKELIRSWASWNKRQQVKTAQKSLTFVNSRVLYDELRPFVADLYETRTTTLTETDFFVRSDTCGSAPPYRLLFVGRMDRAKGLLQMVEAVSILEKRGLDVELNLVGWPEPGDPILDEIHQLAIAKNVDSRVHYLGARSLGKELFECYQNADLYIIASLASEGFPRTIWEAMAHSLPVVATCVGSIPAFTEAASELVEPGSALALADGVEKLIRSPELRKLNIARGRELARSNTLEKQVGEMMLTIQQWLDERHG